MSGSSPLAPFRTRSFRFQWPADLLTAWALEMETLILGWYVLVETGSVLALTVFGSLQFVGTLISPMLGVAGDRLGFRNVLAAMRLCYATFAAVLLAFAATGRLEPAVVLVVAACSGLIRPSDIGMRSALVGATIPPAHLVAAMGVSRTTQDSARVAGALAGAGLIASFGMTSAYVAITAIYLAGALLTLLVTRDSKAGETSVPTGAPSVARPSPWRDLMEGLAYVWRTPQLLAAMSLAALVNLTAFPLTGGLMPYIARDVFHLDQKGLGLLVASFAMGSFIGSVSLSVLGGRVRPARTMLATAVVWYLALMGFVLTDTLAVAMGLLLVAGVCQSFSMITLAILLLKTSDERFRGRIMGVRMLAIYTLPLGLLAAGAMIPQIGYKATALLLVVSGLLLTLEIGVGWRRDLISRDAVSNA
ncbi:MAG: MFS transporter [Hyphomicrobiaceae bacterium]|nr:MFS transporter [Hyphomicrobiaceae bacterium]